MLRRALLVVDVQNEYFTGKLPVTYPEESFEKIITAVDVANQYNIPVILIRHEDSQKDEGAFVKGSNGWNICDAILKKRYLHIIDKKFPGSFTNTELESLLRERAIETVTICGYMTQMCCDSTARQAFHLGFSVEFLADATGTLDIANDAGTISAENLHKAILITQAMKFSQVISTDQWIKIINP